MVLGCLPAWGGSLHNLAQTGQHGRLLHYYFPHYLRRFERLIHFSYVAEAIWEYTGDPSLVERVHMVGNQRPFGRRLYGLVMGLQLRDYFEQCAVLRVFQATGVLPALMAKVLYRTPFLVTYGYRYAELAREVGKAAWKVAISAALERLALRYADGVIVTTPELETYVRGLVPATRIHYIPNGVDVHRFSPRDRGPIQKSSIEVAFVGRMERQKDLPTLFNALKLLTDEGCKCSLRIVGEGSLGEPLGMLAEALGVKVEFLGVIPHEELPAVLCQADVFVLPSIREGHPKALIEAMSCGLPCLASDCEGNRALIAHEKTGLLFPVGDARALAGQLRRIIEQPALAEHMRASARSFVVEHLDIHTLLEREAELLADLASSRAHFRHREAR